MHSSAFECIRGRHSIRLIGLIAFNVDRRSSGYSAASNKAIDCDMISVEFVALLIATVVIRITERGHLGAVDVDELGVLLFRTDAYPVYRKIDEVIHEADAD